VEVVEGLQGTSLFLVGMMGSGKSTVGKLVSQALGYCFFDTGARLCQGCGVLVGSETPVYRSLRSHHAAAACFEPCCAILNVQPAAASGLLLPAHVGASTELCCAGLFNVAFIHPCRRADRVSDEQEGAGDFCRGRRGQLPGD